MEHPIPSGSIRGGTEICKIEDLLKMDREKLKEPNPQLYGNTKWIDPVFAILLMDHLMDLSAAAKDLGTSKANYWQRVTRINASDFRMILKVYKITFPGHLTKENFLKRKIKKRKRGQKVSTLMVMAALKRNNGNVAKAAKELGCSVSTVYDRMLRMKP
jgi:hypothetical protein